LGWGKDYEEMFEISPQYKVTWGSAVRFTEIRSDEYMAMARIAQDKAYLARALLLKAKHRAQWVKEWAKEKEESESEIPECVQRLLILKIEDDKFNDDIYTFSMC